LNREGQIAAFHEEAKRAILGERFGEAIDLLEAAESLDPRDSMTRMLEGVALANSGQVELAEAAFRLSVADPLAGYKPPFNYAVFLVGQGRENEARVQLTEAARRDPSAVSVSVLTARLNRTPGEEIAEPISPMSARMVPPVTSFEESLPGRLLQRNGGTFFWVGGLLCFVFSVSAVAFFFLSIKNGLNKPSEQLWNSLDPTMWDGFKATYWLSLLLSTAYLIFQVYDRRRPGSWVVVNFLAHLVLLGFVTMGGFLISERKN
jgi:tetratricopeptide (TPR) repeat protein